VPCLPAMPTVLKLTYQGEVRRAPLQGEFSYEAVQETIRATWPELRVCIARYRDEEGDLCTLVPATFPDFLAVTAANQAVLRLELAEVPFAAAEVEAPHAAEALPVVGGPSTCGAGRDSSTAREQVEVGANQAWPSLAALHHGLLPGPEVGAESASSNAGGLVHGAWPSLGPRKDWHWKAAVWYFSLLRASGTLSGSVVAGLMAQQLPTVLTYVAEDVGKAGRLLLWNLPKLQSTLQSLLSLAAETPGLEHCQTGLMELLMLEPGTTPGAAAATGTAAGEVVLALLTALDVLSFAAKVSFFEAFYAMQEAELLKLLDEAEPWIPAWSEAMDWCTIWKEQCTKVSELFSKMGCKGTARNGQSKGTGMHEAVPSTGKPTGTEDEAGACEGQHRTREAKGDGTPVGQGSDWTEKRHHQASGMEALAPAITTEVSAAVGLAESAVSSTRLAPHWTCATPGCAFRPTWHPSHCCMACAAAGKDKHGPRCERKAAVTKKEWSAVANTQESEVASCEHHQQPPQQPRLQQPTHQPQQPPQQDQ